MPIRSEALPWVLPPALVTVAAAATGQTGAAVVLALLAGALAAFFRDPERTSDAPEWALLSPADGRVVEVEQDDDGASIAVFLSVFNVHVTRAPVTGRLLRCEEHAGGFRAAFRSDASDNFRYALAIATPWGRVELDLIAGAVARRIVPWVEADDPLLRGQRIALIRFGSRAELRMPAGCEPVVAVGDPVRAGVTPVARAPRHDTPAPAGRR